jgi:polyphosphate kinase 2
MFELISEVHKMKRFMGILVEEEQTPDSVNRYAQNILNILKFSGLYSSTIKKLIDKIIKMGQDKIIDFDLMERGLKSVMLKKGNRKKNVEDYFLRIFTSLEFREKGIYGIEPETEDFGLDIEDVSIVPKKIFSKELYGLQVELIKLQEWLSKTGKTVIIVFEGRDSAGKGSTIKKFTENMNPKLFKVIQLGIPTPEDRADWWGRYKTQIEPGKINLFDRSWYNRGLIEPVAGYGTPEEYEDFMENVENFENSLVEDGDFLFKLWFSIEKETMVKRFKQRLVSPLKKWKYSPNDEKMVDLWDRFTEFKEKLFDKTSTVNHPWVVLDSTDKRVSGLNAIRYVLQNIPYEGKNEEFLNKEFPEALTVLRPE